MLTAYSFTEIRPWSRSARVADQCPVRIEPAIISARAGSLRARGPPTASRVPDRVHANDSCVVFGPVVDVMARLRKQQPSSGADAGRCVRQPGMRRASELAERRAKLIRED